MASTASNPFEESEDSEERASVEDWFAIPEDMGAELVGGRIVYKGAPGAAHSRAQMGLMELLRAPYHRKTSIKDKPGGWWIAVDTDMDLADLGCRPDVLGWRRDKHATMPAPALPALVTAVPSWICEILSPSTAHLDMGDKRVSYHRAGVQHYWLADPTNGTLTVLQWAAHGYVAALVASRGEKVHAAPFVEVEIDITQLFGEEGDKEPSSGPAPSSRSRAAMSIDSDE